MRFVKLTLSVLITITMLMAAGCGDSGGGEVKSDGAPNPHTIPQARPSTMAPATGKTQSVKPTAQ